MKGRGKENLYLVEYPRGKYCFWNQFLEQVFRVQKPLRLSELAACLSRGDWADMIYITQLTSLLPTYPPLDQYLRPVMGEEWMYG